MPALRALGWLALLGGALGPAAAQTTRSPAAPADTLHAPPPALPGPTADPHLVAFGDTYYLYPTTDGLAGWGAKSFSAWSSKDLVKWKNEGVILDLPRDLTWADRNAWAPAMATRGGRYYFYYSAAQSIGVAVGPSPTGPFQDPLGHALVAKGAYHGQAIDPMVLVDDDGSAYLYWGQGQCHAVKLNADLVSYDPAAVIEFKPAGYNEGPFVLKRQGKYYLMWSEYDTRDPRYSVAYATASSPLGPWAKAAGPPVLHGRGVVQGAGHHSVAQVPGTDQWVIAYHRFIIPGGNGYNRETCLSPLRFDSQGNILSVNVFEPVKPTRISSKRARHQPSKPGG